MTAPVMSARTYLGTRSDAGWTRCSRSDCQREHAERHDGDDAMMCPVTPGTLTPETLIRMFTDQDPLIARCARDALGVNTDGSRVDLPDTIRAWGRRRVCNAINARRAKEVNHGNP